MINVEQLTKTLEELDVTANQFLLAYYLYTDEKKNGAYVKDKRVGLANLYRYSQSPRRQWKFSEIEDMINRGYLIDIGKNKKMEADFLQVTDKFIDAVFASTNRFSQIWEMYPKTMPSFDGSPGSIKLKVCDPSELEDVYCRLVKTKRLHEEIVSLLQWGIEHKQVNLGIEKFVKAQFWETLRELKEKYSSVGATPHNMPVAR